MSVTVVGRTLTLTLVSRAVAVTRVGTQGPAGGSAATNTARNEVPAGAINDVNATFTLAQIPSPAESLMLFRGGIYQRPGGVDYTLTGLSIQYVRPMVVGETHVAHSYTY